MTVAVVLTKAAQKDVDGLTAPVMARVAAAIVALREYPAVTGVKALKGDRKGQYRVRVGTHRILFTLDAGTITIIAVDDRKDVY